MAPAFTATARRLGLLSSLGSLLLGVSYAAVLCVGLWSLDTPGEPIADPIFSLLEVLILLMAPLLVALMVAVHAWAEPQRKALSLLAVVFMSLLAGVTCSVHFVILTISRHPVLTREPLMPLLLGFRWPSLAYALDILAWDVFFALSMLCAAPVFRGSRLARWIRGLMIVSAVLALAGLGGAAAGDMQWRNIGILGYSGVFLIVAGLLAVLFSRARPGA